MRFVYTERFNESFADAPGSVQKSFLKQARFLLGNLRHPSLHAKKYDEARDIWQARVNRDWRFYFTIQGDIYLLRDIVKHPK